MDKKTVVATVVIALVIVGTIAYAFITKEPATYPKDKTNNASNTQTNDQPATSNTPTAAPGKYVDYSAEAVASTEGTKLLFFYAPWCPQCRALDADIKNNQLPQGVTIFKVDYDSHQDLRQKYGVTIQTTLVKVDNSGEKLTSYVAYDDPSFEAVRQNLLP